MTDEKLMRKTPQQKRSKQRVDHILDTAERLFAEMGYEPTTTNAIAEHAGVSIGSLYQFFPNKDAVRDALIERYLTEMREAKGFNSDEVLATTPISLMVRELVKNIMAFSMSHRGFETLFNTQFQSAVIHDEIVASVVRILTHRFPQLDPVRRHTTAVILVAIVKGVMHLPETSDSLTTDVVNEEIAQALLAYLRTVLLREGIPVPNDIA